MFVGWQPWAPVSPSVLTVIEVVAPALRTGMGTSCSKVPQPEVREQGFKAKPGTHRSTQVDGSRIPETGLAQSLASTV